MMNPNTLYLSNLPSNPVSLPRFKKFLLTNIDPALKISDNNVLNNSTRFRLKRDTINKPRILDHTYGVLDISRYGSHKLRNSCFITFIDSESCEKFKSTFTNKLIINGRLIKIEYAKSPSYLSLYHNKGPTEVESELSRKRACKKVDNLRLTKEKRRLRRARSKLRSKGLDEKEINKLLFEKKDREQATTKKTVTKVVEIIGNPPHTILLVQKLPPGITEQEVNDIFNGDGLKEIRLVSIRNLCFVEYNSIENASKIMDRLGTTHNINGHEISIGYAKK